MSSRPRKQHQDVSLIQVVHCQESCLFCFSLVTTPASTIYYSHVVVLFLHSTDKISIVYPPQTLGNTLNSQFLFVFLLQTLQRLISHRDGIQTIDILQIEPQQQPDMETPKGEFWYF